MNNYLTGIEGMPKLIDCCEGDPLKYFQKKKYVDSFQRMYQEHFATFEAIEACYNTVIDKEQCLDNMADALTAHAAEYMNSCKGKHKKDQKMIDLNLTMAVFVLPMILEYHGDSSQALAERLIASWKREFPTTNLKAAEYTVIEKGFHRKFCYITTAVCHTFGKPDDCYELNLLREYRDTYLADSPGGAELIEEYYDVAPSIVKHIDQQPDASAIYQSIWDEWIAPCITMIEAQQPEACREHYIEMVHTLQERYFRINDMQ